MKPPLRFLALLVLLAALPACSPQFRPPDPASRPAAMTGQAFIMPDGAMLPYRVWAPKNAAKAVVIALHGFNDYHKAFRQPANWWASRGILTYAYDQRGFGGTADAGYWPTGDALREDLRTVLGLIGAKHPDLPIFVLGESMGAAVAMATLAGPQAADGVSGLVLVAPAVWGWRSLNPFYQVTLWWAAHLFPGMRLTGESLDVQASDNIAMLRALARDPKVIKKTRVDAIYGLVILMQEAADSVSNLEAPTLVLYGDQDEVIRDKPFTKAFAERADFDIRRYPHGFHMLLRDCQAPRVWRDVSRWLQARTGGPLNDRSHDLEIALGEAPENPQCDQEAVGDDGQGVDQNAGEILHDGGDADAS